MPAGKPKRFRKKRWIRDPVARKNYSDYLRLGLSPRDAGRWAHTLARLAKDHWHKPKCGW